MKNTVNKEEVSGFMYPRIGKSRIFRILPVILVLFSFLISWSSPAQQSVRMDTVEKLIWALEESYFVNLYKANYPEVISLYDTHFLGWPNGLKHPIGVEESTRFMKQLIPKPTSCMIRIEQAGISVVGKTALTQYTLHVDCKDISGGPKTQSSRITHTWIKKETGWKLIGGMSIDQ